MKEYIPGALNALEKCLVFIMIISALSYFIIKRSRKGDG